jgi:hypothetical protein
MNCEVCHLGPLVFPASRRLFIGAVHVCTKERAAATRIMRTALRACAVLQLLLALACRGQQQKFTGYGTTYTCEQAGGLRL